MAEGAWVMTEEAVAIAGLGASRFLGALKELRGSWSNSHWYANGYGISSKGKQPKISQRNGLRLEL
jgi:hypothetical protein